MPAHIKVVKRGWPCPRLHFHDDTARTGKIYVGYLGEHLPTARFAKVPYGSQFSLAGLN